VIRFKFLSPIKMIPVASSGCLLIMEFTKIENFGAVFLQTLLFKMRVARLLRGKEENYSYFLIERVRPLPPKTC